MVRQAHHEGGVGREAKERSNKMDSRVRGNDGVGVARLTSPPPPPSFPRTRESIFLPNRTSRKYLSPPSAPALFSPHSIARTESATNACGSNSWGGAVVCPLGRGSACRQEPADVSVRPESPAPGMRKRPLFIRTLPYPGNRLLIGGRMFEPENRFPLFLNMLLQERSQSRERTKLGQTKAM